MANNGDKRKKRGRCRGWPWLSSVGGKGVDDRVEVGGTGERGRGVGMRREVGLGGGE